MFASSGPGGLALPFRSEEVGPERAEDLPRVTYWSWGKNRPDPRLSLPHEFSQLCRVQPILSP